MSSRELLFCILESGSPAFDEFLDFLGQRVRLKGFDQYKGGLDVRGDTTGTHSIYAEYQAHEIMFHVSTLLPFTPSNKQQVRSVLQDISLIIDAFFSEHYYMFILYKIYKIQIEF